MTNRSNSIHFTPYGVLLCILLTCNYLSYSQVTIRTDVVEKAVVKPPNYDSLVNFSYQINPIDYYQFIGQKLYFMPFSKKFYKKDSSFLEFKSLYTKNSVSFKNPHRRPFHETEIAKFVRKDQYESSKKLYEESIPSIITNVYVPVYNATKRYFYSNRDSISGKYFTIIDIEGTDQAASYNSTFKKIDTFKKWDRLVLKVTLRKDITGDTLYWLFNTSLYYDKSPFLLVPYFTKQKRLHENKTFVTNKALDGIVDINSGTSFNLVQNEKVVCSEVTLIESERNPYAEPSYVLKNSKRMELKIPLNINFHEPNESELYYKFTSIEEYELKENMKLYKAEEREKQEIAAREIEQEKAKRAHEERKKTLKLKYDKRIGNLIYEGKVTLGMTKEMCIDAWGKPNEVNRTIVSGLTHEQWVYGHNHYLYFDNDLLVAIQN